jgi:hypothetical protein
MDRQEGTRVYRYGVGPSTPRLSRDHVLTACRYPWFLETFDGYPYPIQRADAIRYFVLHHFGGIYIDLDDVRIHESHSHLTTNKLTGMQPQSRPSLGLPCMGAPYCAYWNLQRRHGLNSPPSFLPQGYRITDRLQSPMAPAIHHRYGLDRSALPQHHLATLQQCDARGRRPCAHSLP